MKMSCILNEGIPIYLLFAVGILRRYYVSHTRVDKGCDFESPEGTGRLRSSENRGKAHSCDQAEHTTTGLLLMWSWFPFLPKHTVDSTLAGSQAITFLSKGLYQSIP